MIERHRRAPYVRTLALLVSWAGLAGAAELQVSTAPQAPTDAAPEVRTENGALLLTIEEAVTVALQRNLGIAVQRYSREASRLGIQQNLGIYDLGLSADTTYTDTESLSQSGLSTSSAKVGTFDINLAQLVPTGGTFAFGWQNRKTESPRPIGLPEGSPFQTVFYSSSPTLQFTQPLLRNFGRETTEHDLLVARLNSDQSREAFVQQVTNVVQLVENAYWDLFGARQQLRVAEEALGLAKELHQMNKVRVDVGTLAPLELVQSEVGIATSEENIITAQAAVGDAADRLRRLLNFRQGEAWNVDIIPETDPATEHPAMDVAAAISTAFEARPELASQRLAVKVSEIDAAFFHNQRKPKLDAFATYGLRGGGGRSSNAIDNITDFPEWSVGLSFAFPLQNRFARAQSTIADVNLERSQTTQKDVELQIVTEVRTAARQVDTAAKQIDSAKISRTLAEKNLDAERKRYENGMSTSFQVTQIQQDLTAARSREVSAITGYRKALVEYYRAIGKLLEQNSIEVLDEGKPAAEATVAAQ